MRGAPRETSEMNDDQIYGSKSEVPEPSAGKRQVVRVVTTTAVFVFTAVAFARMFGKNPE